MKLQQPLPERSSLLRSTNRYRPKLIYTIGPRWILSGWQDWVIFQQLGYFWNLIGIIWKRWKSPKKWQQFWPLLTQAIFYNFTSIRCFKAWLGVRILRLKRGLMLMFSDFKIELSCKYFGTIWLGNCFGYFLKIWVIFSAFWSPWIP